MPTPSVAETPILANDPGSNQFVQVIAPREDEDSVPQTEPHPEQELKREDQSDVQPPLEQKTSILDDTNAQVFAEPESTVDEEDNGLEDDPRMPGSFHYPDDAQAEQGAAGEGHSWVQMLRKMTLNK